MLNRLGRRRRFRNQQRRRNLRRSLRDGPLRMESLEPRHLLTTITVGTDLDVLDGNVNSIDDLIRDPGADRLISLREAVIASNNTSGPDEIKFDRSLDGKPIKLTLAGAGEDFAQTGDLDVLDDLMILGNGTLATVINAGGTKVLRDRVFDLHERSSLSIESLTVTGGAPSPLAGGAILVSAADLELRDTVISGNEAGDGGGMMITSGLAITSNLHVIDSVVSGNVASQEGGGLHATNHLNATTNISILRSTITGNLARNGGGIYHQAGVDSFSELQIQDSTISGNTASEAGGGIYNLTSTSYGYGYYGPASAAVTISNSTISGNTAGVTGGGIENYSYSRDGLTTLAVLNSTIAGNDAKTSRGGGIRNNLYSRLALDNTIVAGNRSVGSGADLENGGQIAAATHNLIQDPSGHPITNGADGNLVGVDPRLGPLADNGGPTLTHELFSGSAAIDAGDDARALNTSGKQLVTDQRGTGFERFVGNAVDIGSYESVTLVDYGDAPDESVGTSVGNYQTSAIDQGPAHAIIPGMYLGKRVDGEDGTAQDADAVADDHSSLLADVANDFVGGTVAGQTVRPEAAGGGMWQYFASHQLNPTDPSANLEEMVWDTGAGLWKARPLVLTRTDSMGRGSAFRRGPKFTRTPNGSRRIRCRAGSRARTTPARLRSKAGCESPIPAVGMVSRFTFLSTGNSSTKSPCLRRMAQESTTHSRTSPLPVDQPSISS